jgi:hypothetical protein
MVLFHATKMHGTLNQNFVVFSTPLEALEALSQLIPHRRKHVVRYYGAAHPLVREIYGLRPGHHPRIEQLPHPLLRLGRRRWARTLWLIYGIDVMQCPRCNCRMLHIATIIDHDVISRILLTLRLNTTHPQSTSARAPPLYSPV